MILFFGNIFGIIKNRNNCGKKITIQYPQISNSYDFAGFQLILKNYS